MSAHQSHRLAYRGAAARIVCALAVSALAFLAPRGAFAQQPNSRAFIDSGSMTVAGYGATADLDPASDELASSAMVGRTIEETLLNLDGASIDRYVPALATSWSANADKSVWTVHLRHGVKFHTGRCCLTADDVKYSLGRSVAAGLSGSYMLGRFLDSKNPFKQIKVVDPYTVEFDLGRPQPVFAGALAQDYNALILDSQDAKRHATKADPWAHNWVTDHDLGTGPYMLQSWSHGQQVVLTRFKDYWGGWSGAHFSTIYIRSVPEPTTRRELVERGEADIAQNLTPQDYDQLKSNSKVKVVVGPTTEVEYLPMTEWGPLASPYARQALSYAFNYDAYIKAAYRQYARRAYGPLASTLLGYDPNMFHYQTDLNKARALLAKAGVKPGTTLTYAYSSGLQNFQIAGGILQAQLAQLGITLKIQSMDEATFNGVFYGNEAPSKRPNIMEFGWWPDYNDPYDESVNLVASYAAGSAGANAGFYHNKQVDALLAEMKNGSREVLIADAKKLQDITGRQDPPCIWLDEPLQVVVTAGSLKGLIINPLTIGTYDFYALHR